MSWSFYATGKPVPLLAKARKDLSAFNCAEPEETIKGKVLDIIEAALLAMPESSAVTIKAAGSQSPAYDGEDKRIAGKLSSGVMLTIEPIFAFVE